jgi:uncharacterized protein YaiE (UPF0345 family)
MYLPKSEKGKYAYGEVKSSKIMEYTEAIHLRKAEIKDVKVFGDDDSFSVPSKSSSDFSLD